MSLLNYSPLYPKVNFLTYLILQKKKKKNIYIYIHREREREREKERERKREREREREIIIHGRVDMEFLFECLTR